MKHSIAKNTTPISPADLNIIKDNLEIINSKIDPAVSKILPQQKKNYQKMGPKFESSKGAALEVIQNHPEIFPPSFNTANLSDYLKKNEDFSHLAQSTKMILIKCENSACVNGILAVNEINMIYEYVLAALPSNPALKNYARAIGKFYSKKPRKQAVVFSINESTSIDFNNAKPKTNFNNLGITLLSLSEGPDLNKRVKRVAKIYVEPGNSVKVPVGYKSITISNESATVVGNFSLKLST